MKEIMPNKKTDAIKSGVKAKCEQIQVPHPRAGPSAHSLHSFLSFKPLFGNGFVYLILPHGDLSPVHALLGDGELSS